MVVLMSFSTTAQSKSAIANFQKAQDAFRNNSPEQGWKFLQKSMDKGADNYYQPFIYAGDRKFNEGDTEEAIKYYDHALNIKPLSSVYLKKSIVYKYAFDFDASIESYIIYMKNARMSPERRIQSEAHLENLKFTSVKYEEYIGLNAPPEIMKLVFSDDKMEYFPSLTGDDKRILFTARRLEEGVPNDENLYVATREGKDWSSSAQPVLGRVNSRVNEGASSISADGNFMVFTACDRPGGVGSCDLYYSYFNPKTGWGMPKLLPGDINTKKWESQPSLGPNGTTLYFVRGTHSKAADLDIMVAKKNDQGVWNDVQRLPKEINSKHVERSPFIHFDGKTLYFVSGRSPSIGGDDFFMSTKLDDTLWSEPVNLGFPLNSFGDEFSMVIDASGEHGYISSNRGSELLPEIQNQSLYDLYEFNVPKELQPSKRVFKDFRVVHNSTRVPLGLAVVRLFTLKNEEVFTGTSSKNTGLVRAMQSANEDLRISAYKKGFLPYSAVISKETLLAQDDIEELPLMPLSQTASFVLRNILFDSNMSELLSESENELEILLKLLQDEPSLKATIVGHTDNQGSRGYNKRLSLDRANAVMDWLTAKGIAASRISAEGRGMDEPVASNDTEQGRAQNRRTAVQLR